MEWKKFLRGSRRMLTGFLLFGSAELCWSWAWTLRSDRNLSTCVMMMIRRSWKFLNRWRMLRRPMSLLSKMLNEIVPVPQKISFLASSFFLHFRNSLDIALVTFREHFFSSSLSLPACSFMPFPFPIKLTFIWISAKIATEIRSGKKKSKIALRCAKLNRIPRKEIFRYNSMSALCRGSRGRHMETPKMSR